VLAPAPLLPPPVNQKGEGPGLKALLPPKSKPALQTQNRSTEARIAFAPSEAWERRKWTCRKPKPLIAARQVINPARQRLATSRNRVLRGLGVTRIAKRTQGVCRPRDRASKVGYRGSRRCMQCGRQHRGAKSLAPRFRRGRRAGHVHTGAAQELGNTCYLRPGRRLGIR
jgi:hypothetical protein